MKHTRTLGALVAVFVLVAGTGAYGSQPYPPGGTGPHKPQKTMPVYHVVRSGLSPTEARRLADVFSVPPALTEDGSFVHVSDQSGHVPTMPVPAQTLRDEEGGMSTVAEAFDLAAIGRMRPLDPVDARHRLKKGFHRAQIEISQPSRMVVTHTKLELESLDGKTSVSAALDTSVNVRFTLGSHPLEGPGAKLRVTFDGEGHVTELRYAARILQEGEQVPVMGPMEAKAECARHYPAGAKLDPPTLLYWAPPLHADDVDTIFPHYMCQGVEAAGAVLNQAVVPATLGAGPDVTVEATAQGLRVQAQASATGGTQPYRYEWRSMTTDLDPLEATGPSISYVVVPRTPATQETLWVDVVDANGLSASARAIFPVAAKRLAPGTVAPAAVGQLDVGGEFTVYDWQCVKDSAAGFGSTFSGHGVPVAFKWTGYNAWERDFRQTGAPTNGDDASYVDNVDLAWYTGHGNTGSFTFDNTTHDDGSIVPGDARWGDRDLEWLQLESCNVLSYALGESLFTRWGATFDGLHLLNGFQTTASCINVAGGTAGRFSSYLFPRDFLFFTVPALKVRQAWAQMAIDLEPSGKQYVTMGAAGPGWVTNYNDYFWGQGPVGPDIPQASIIGMWRVVGTV